MRADRAPALPAVFAGRRRRWLLALVANGVARALLAALVVLAVRSLLVGSAAPAGPAQIFQGHPMAWAAAVVGCLAVVVLALAWLRQRETVHAEAVAQHYIAHVRLRMFDRLLTMTPAQAQRRSRGGVLMRFVGDVQALRAWVGRGIPSLLVSGGMGAVLLAVLAWLAPPLAAGVAVLMLVLGLVLMRLWPALYDATAMARRRQAFIAANVQDKIAALPALQVAGRAPQERRRLRRQNTRLRRALQARARWRGWHRGAVTVATGGVTISMAAYGAWLVMQGPGWAHVGTVFGAAVIVGLLLTPLRELGRAAEVWVGARVARARVVAFLQDLPEAQRPGAEAVGAHLLDNPDGKGEAGDPELHALSSPPSTDAMLPERPEMQLQRPSLGHRVRGPVAGITHGRRVALVGPAGAGKSSLLQMMAGLQVPTAGTVLLGGLPLSTLSQRQLRRHLTLLSPDLPLMRGSVGDNVRYHAGNSAPQAVRRALALSGLAALLPGLPDGLDTRVRDGGSNLSHGQRRAVQLARALAGRPSVLLIDDVAACLPGDPAVALQALLAGWSGTVVFATADPALGALADEVWAFDGGECVDDRPALPAVVRPPPALMLQ